MNKKLRILVTFELNHFLLILTRNLEHSTYSAVPF